MDEFCRLRFDYRTNQPLGREASEYGGLEIVVLDANERVSTSHVKRLVAL